MAMASVATPIYSQAALCHSSSGTAPRLLPRPRQSVFLHPYGSSPLPQSCFPPFSDRFLSDSVRTRQSTCAARSSATERPEEEEEDPNWDAPPDEEVEDLGVRVALSVLKFYKREISPLMLPSCRCVPTCSVYSMEAYKKYGVLKGTILTAWRLCRCNPLGGTGFDPPRWFGEEKPHEKP
ncbi:UPF0161 protein At3g09310-like [Zingiber officinale]|uniref:UPF0161 protein At3g09310-like n=1 Tax=Zingiber officinale TaxID=94328 RepID=UPI001C4D77B7|nr:UPF0161 protein At3g09310-like [Zingiber officinale]XP_042454320.1 UPF0161 protein At3g09310-like [Zingiber officinale]XP_042454324.1 UPF0161 protein At3g09310-like [Zingiber officinale]